VQKPCRTPPPCAQPTHREEEATSIPAQVRTLEPHLGDLRIELPGDGMGHRVLDDAEGVVVGVLRILLHDDRLDPPGDRGALLGDEPAALRGNASKSMHDAFLLASRLDPAFLCVRSPAITVPGVARLALAAQVCQVPLREEDTRQSWCPSNPGALNQTFCTGSRRFRARLLQAGSSRLLVPHSMAGNDENGGCWAACPTHIRLKNSTPAAPASHREAGVVKSLPQCTFFGRTRTCARRYSSRTTRRTSVSREMVRAFFIMSVMVRRSVIARYCCVSTWSGQKP